MAMVRDESSTAGALAAARGHFERREAFLVNAFERRFQGMLREAWRERSWHVIAATMGSGKSFGIGDLVEQSGAFKAEDGRTRLPILTACAPTNQGPESKLLMALAARFGVVPRMTSAQLRTWLVGEMARSRVEMIVIDDAHELALPHLMLLKELTDVLEQPPYGRKVALCLVCATARGEIELRNTFEQQAGLLWQQFRRRLDEERPYCLILGHTAEELPQILEGFEELYRPQLPALDLFRWSDAIYRYLTSPLIDREGRGRVTMQNVTRFVTISLRAAHALGHADVGPEVLQQTANVMMLKGNTVIDIDGEPLGARVDAVEVG